MAILVIQILYGLMFLSMVLMSVFIVFHIVFYSYSTFGKLMTLAIFVSVVAVLLFANLMLFSSFPLETLLSGLNI